MSDEVGALLGKRVREIEGEDGWTGVVVRRGDLPGWVVVEDAEGDEYDFRVTELEVVA